jgi:hypothetical protein
MLTFEQRTDGYAVKIDGKTFGYISRRQGFFTDSTVIIDSIKVSPSELRRIALRSEVEQGFVTCPCGFITHPIVRKENHIEYTCTHCLELRIISTSEIY